MTGSCDEAEDFVQEASIAFGHKSAGLVDSDSARRWRYGVAANTCLKRTAGSPAHAACRVLCLAGPTDGDALKDSGPVPEI